MGSIRIMGNTRIMGNGVWGVGCAPRAHNRNTPKWEQIVPTETKPRTCMETLASLQAAPRCGGQIPTHEAWLQILET